MFVTTAQTWNRFSEFWYRELLLKFVYRFHFSLKSNNYGNLYVDVIELLRQYIGKLPKHLSEKNYLKTAGERLEYILLPVLNFIQDS